MDSPCTQTPQHTLRAQIYGLQSFSQRWTLAGDVCANGNAADENDTSDARLENTDGDETDNDEDARRECSNNASMATSI